MTDLLAACWNDTPSKYKPHKLTERHKRMLEKGKAMAKRKKAAITHRGKPKNAATCKLSGKNGHTSDLKMIGMLCLSDMRYDP
jgi:hypothetical protein